MKRTGSGTAGRWRPLVAAGIALAWSVAPAYANGHSHVSHSKGEATVRTDGHLRPEHIETVRVKGFPGKGRTEIAFLPTAICENGCGAISRRSGKTNARGAGKLQVRVPGTFIGQGGRHIYFRDGERIDLEVFWNGAHHTFDMASANPDPIFVRTHVTASTAGAAPNSSFTTSGQLFVPSSFELQGSNGYSIFVLGQPSHKGQPATVELFVQKKHVGVYYSAPATVTETSIQANLGELGEISVNFHRSGVAAIASPRCGRPVSFDSGSFEGKIDLHGEEGYTEAEATSVPGNVDFLLNGICGGFVTSGGSNPFSPGAELYLRNPALGAEFSVVKSRPGSPARFEVGDREYRDGISIQRFASLVMPPATFAYGPHLQTATVRPPAPFSGTAHFDRRKKANRRWSGDLAIDLPGRTGLPLTGPQLRAYLVRP